MNDNYAVQNLRVAVLQLNESVDYWRNKCETKDWEIEQLREEIKELKGSKEFPLGRL